MTARITINPITCDGHGLCAGLLPEEVPVARRARQMCPTLAVLLS